MDSFEKGYSYFEKSAPAHSGSNSAVEYVKHIKIEIDSLTGQMNSVQGFQTDGKILKGDMAEFWHSGTHNIDAAAKGLNIRTTVERSHDFASSDIVSDEGIKYGLKYFSSGEESAKSQSVSIFQRYAEYRAGKINSGLEVDEFDLFMQKRGLSESIVMYDPIYLGQVRIIPKDQMEQAIDWLERKIAKETSIRPAQVGQYQDTLDNLRDKITSSRGSESIALTRGDAEELARLSKDGAFNPKDFGLTTEEIVRYQLILNKAFKAGLTAATISLVLRVAPEIYKTLDYLMKNGEIDPEQFKRIGFAALSGSSEGFIRGSVSAAITTACLAGLWGEAFKAVNPVVVATITVLMMDVMKNSYYVATGKMERGELVDSFIRNMYISSGALILGSVLMVQLSVFGFLLGSFVGSLIGSYAFTASYKTYLSFCISTGFTLFGVVDQNYDIPEEVLKEVGIEVFEYEKYYYDEFEPERFEVIGFNAINLKPNTIDITIVKRGVIGINQIGYV